MGIELTPQQSLQGVNDEALRQAAQFGDPSMRAMVSAELNRRGQPAGGLGGIVADMPLPTAKPAPSQFAGMPMPTARPAPAQFADMPQPTHRPAPMGADIPMPTERPAPSQFAGMPLPTPRPTPAVWPPLYPVGAPGAGPSAQAGFEGLGGQMYVPRPTPKPDPSLSLPGGNPEADWHVPYGDGEWPSVPPRKPGVDMPLRLGAAPAMGLRRPPGSPQPMNPGGSVRPQPQSGLGAITAGAPSQAPQVASASGPRGASIEFPAPPGGYGPMTGGAAQPGAAPAPYMAPPSANEQIDLLSMTTVPVPGRLYQDPSSGRVYRWTGQAFVEVG